MVRLSVCKLHISHFEVIVYVYHVGVYIIDEHPEDQALFVTERCCFSDLVESLFFLSLWADNKAMGFRVCHAG